MCCVLLRNMYNKLMSNPVVMGDPTRELVTAIGILGLVSVINLVRGPIRK